MSLNKRLIEFPRHFDQFSLQKKTQQNNSIFKFLVGLQKFSQIQFICNFVQWIRLWISFHLYSSYIQIDPAPIFLGILTNPLEGNHSLELEVIIFHIKKYFIYDKLGKESIIVILSIALILLLVIYRTILCPHILASEHTLTHTHACTHTLQRRVLLISSRRSPKFASLLPWILVMHPQISFHLQPEILLLASPFVYQSCFLILKQ